MDEAYLITHHFFPIANSLETIGTFQFDVFLVFTRTWRFCSVTMCICALRVLEGGVD
jgi:hypothetical protein